MEGFWGLVLSCVALPVLQFVRGPDGQPLDSISTALAVSLWGHVHCCAAPSMR